MQVIHRGLILVGVPLLLASTVIGSMFFLILQTDQDRRQEARETRRSEHSCRLMLTLFDAGYAFEHALIQGNREMKDRLKKDLVEIRAEQDGFLAVEPTENASMAMNELNDLLTSCFDPLRRFVQAMKAHNLSMAGMQEMASMQGVFSQKAYRLSSACNDIVAKALLYLEKSQPQRDAIFHLETAALVGGVIASIFSGLLLARSFATAIVDRLQVISDNSIRLARGLSLNPPLRGSDDIAALDRAFHAMANKLNAATAKERALFENASDLIFVSDQDNRFTAVNPAVTRIMGYLPGTLVGTHLLTWIHDDDQERTSEAIEKTRHGKPAITFETRMRHQDGHYVDVLCSAYWSKLDAALYVVAHDISDRKQVERLKEEFLSMVSHDLRSPLASIYGTFQLITAKAFGQIPEAATEKIAAVTLNVNRLLSLVNDLLDMEKLEAGKLDITKSLVSVDTLVSRSVGEVEALAKEKQLAIVATPSGDSFSMDEDRMTQVLVNLLANAIKFSPSGSTINVEASVVDGDLQIRVIDHGRGIPKNDLTAVFERFKQVRVTDGHNNAGTGLGLPICKQIVERHGGSIRVESEVNKGSTFIIELPGDRVSGQPTATAPVATASQQPASVDVGLSSVAMQASSQFQSGRNSLPTRLRSEGLGIFDNVRLLQKGAILVVVPIAFELVFAGCLFNVLHKSFEASQRELHQDILSTSAADMVLNFYKAGTVMNCEKTKENYVAFLQTAKDVDILQAKMMKLTEHLPHAREQLLQAELALKPASDFFAKARDYIEKHGVSEDTMVTAYSGKGDLEYTLVDATPYLLRLATPPASQDDSVPSVQSSLRKEQSFLLEVGLLLSALISIGSAFLFSIGITKRLKLMEENARRLESDQPLNAVLGGTDEVAHLDQVFHNMADAIREARRKERAVFDNAQDVMCVIEPDTHITRISPACERMWGYPQEELLDRPFLEMVHPGDKQKSIDALQKDCLAANPTILENRVVRKDGSLCDVLWSLSWSPESKTLFAIAHDVTLQKELERLKKEFLSMVSHEMRTPLTSVQMSTEMLAAGAMGKLPEKAEQQLSVVVRNCDRLLALINDLLDLDKLESGRMQLDTKAISSHSVLERTVQSLDSFAQQHKVAVTVEPGEEVVINGDENRLVQVGVNLLSNAIKFSPEGSTVRLSVITHGEFAELRVTDSGRGIPEQYRATVFERFKQVEASDGKRRAGTGLGLPICKEIVESHGGTIGVESEIGKGSTFWFRIPLATKLTTCESV